MSDNPYEAPEAELDDVVGVVSGTREDLRRVAKYQKGILVCILINVCSVITSFALPPEVRFVVAIVALITGIVGTVFVFLLAIKVHSTGIGILLGILAMVPCFGMIILLMVNGKATTILKLNGIKVGLLGANLREI